MIDIPIGLQPELVPLSWLIGTWEGPGMIEYAVDGELRQHAFRQRVEFTHHDLPFLEYRAEYWLVDGDEQDAPPALSAERGFWRLARPRGAGDVGPGILPPTAPAPHPNAESVETLRVPGGFRVEVTLAHPTGVAEIYEGTVNGPRIDLRTAHITRAEGSHEYDAATRMYGLVHGMLFWAWDIAALGQDLATHASATLARVNSAPAAPAPRPLGEPAQDAAPAVSETPQDAAAHSAAVPEVNEAPVQAAAPAQSADAEADVRDADMRGAAAASSPAAPESASSPEVPEMPEPDAPALGVTPDAAVKNAARVGAAQEAAPEGAAAAASSPAAASAASAASEAPEMPEPDAPALGVTPDAAVKNAARVGAVQEAAPEGAAAASSPAAASAVSEAPAA